MKNIEGAKSETFCSFIHSLHDVHLMSYISKFNYICLYIGAFVAHSLQLELQNCKQNFAINWIQSFSHKKLLSIAYLMMTHTHIHSHEKRNRNRKRVREKDWTRKWANQINFLTQTVKTVDVSENVLAYQLNWYLFPLNIAHVLLANAMVIWRWCHSRLYLITVLDTIVLPVRTHLFSLV